MSCNKAVSPWLYNNHVIKNLKEVFKPPLTETYLNFFNNFRCKHNWALQWHLGIACTCMFSINTKCPQMRPHVLRWDHVSSVETTCPQLRPRVLSWDPVSSVETTCPQLRPHVLSWDHVSSDETTCSQLRPRVLSYIISAYLLPLTQGNAGQIFWSEGRQVADSELKLPCPIRTTHNTDGQGSSL